MRSFFAQCAILVASSTLCSCISVKRNAQPIAVENISEPEIGAEVTVGVGENMVRQATLYREIALTVHAPTTGSAYKILAGEYAKIGEDDNYEFFDKSGVIKAALADPVQAVAAPRNDPEKLLVVTIFGVGADYAADYSIRSRYSPRHNSFQQTLIYSGRIGDKINIAYREFSNDIARPAFSNDVEYDLSESSIIGYKGARIEIVRATNSSITFILHRNFQ